jgi:hypothetical protein
MAWEAARQQIFESLGFGQGGRGGREGEVPTIARESDGRDNQRQKTVVITTLMPLIRLQHLTQSAAAAGMVPAARARAGVGGITAPMVNYSYELKKPAGECLFRSYTGMDGLLDDGAAGARRALRRIYPTSCAWAHSSGLRPLPVAVVASY